MMLPLVPTLGHCSSQWLVVRALLVLLILVHAPAGARADAATPPEPPAQTSVAAVSARLAGAEEALRAEPSAAQVQSWALRSDALDARASRELMRDAKAAGALPWVRLRGRFEDDGRLERDEVGLVKETQQDTGWTAELWLEWDLAEAVAGSARFRAAREVRDQMELRAAVVHQATLAYHDRQRLILEAAIDGAPAVDASALARRAVRSVRIRELDATLDAITGGRWSRALAKGRERRRGTPLDLDEAAPPEGPERIDLPTPTRAVAGG
ncbi:MAG: hypothetical protein KDA24_27105 [Deltaproteobacteria bacterium]|nr:hypothetical protein [Deltaproteobacteria bacterium]